MADIIQGAQQFQGSAFEERQDLFSKLASGQTPLTLFITCSDSRIDPNLLTQTDPGELFVIRNAGNIVPRYDSNRATSEAATIEYAVKALEIPNIVVCGHSKCGAMGGLLDLDHLDALPMVKSYLMPEPAADRVREQFPDATEDSLLNKTIQENVLVQLENLRTHPCVTEAIEAGKLTLHGWVYQFETGDVYVHQAEPAGFVSIREDAGEFA